jgi:hypothetical protein
MTREEVEMATESMVICMNDLHRCVRLGPANTFKPEGEKRMTLTEFLAWVRDKGEQVKERGWV